MARRKGGWEEQPVQRPREEGRWPVKGPAIVIQDGWGLEFKGGWQTMRPERQQGPVLGGLRSVIGKTMRPVEVLDKG